MKESQISLTVLDLERGSWRDLAREEPAFDNEPARDVPVERPDVRLALGAPCGIRETRERVVEADPATAVLVLSHGAAKFP